MNTAPPPAATPDRPFGALLRHYREVAGLSQEALAERAGMSARAIRYLERGSGRPYPDTLRRLTEALALSPAQQEALVAAVHAPVVPVPGAGSAVPVAIPLFATPPPASPLVGRAQELALLRASLAANLAGQGGLVLISGEAGVGKTALAQTLCGEAARQGALVLVGRAYDLSETPPYGPWTEARAQFPPSPDLPPLPSALHTSARSPVQFFAEVHDFFVAAAARQPIVLLLDDLQWADPASLDLLRFLARGTPRMLILAIYRTGEVDRHHPLSQLLPLLVREAHATRLTVLPLPAAALRELARARYALVAGDEERLVAYLAQRTEGNALFATELLRALEEGGALVPGGTTVGDLTGVAVPALLRQMVEGRVVRLGSEAEELLSIAAVIGQEVPPAIWATVAATDERTIEAVAERALAAGLLTEARDGEQLAFAHALIREALYESIPRIRRRRIHRTMGEALAMDKDAAPDAVAYHLQQAGDGRAAGWLARAAWRAYRSFAHATARARFAEAYPQLTGTERAQCLFALATLNRYSEQGIRYAEEAIGVARAAGDEILAAMTQGRLGIMLYYRGRVGEALTALEESERLLAGIPDDAVQDLHGLPALTFRRVARVAFRAHALAYAGRWREVLAELGGTPEAPLAGLPDTRIVNGAVALMYVCALLGRVAEAPRAGARGIGIFEAYGDEGGILAMRMIEGVLLVVPFLLDDQASRQGHDADIARVTRRSEERGETVPPQLHRCPPLIVAGAWAEAAALWAQRRDVAVTLDLAINLPYIGAMARAQGNRDEAWALVHEGVPDGPQTEPGTTHFAAVDLFCLAARLALDEGKCAQARQWLEAHERWLAWAGSEVQWGRANGYLAWAEYYRAIGESDAALRHTEQALAAANAPRQPLDLLAGHRLLGELLREVGRHAEARAHVDAALALADACGAPYERALTLLASAALDATTGNVAVATATLDEVRAICTPLGAQPVLDRATLIMSHPELWQSGR